MLERLEVRNLALIESLDLEPGEGLNLVTGETGSGKSLLVDALGLAVGGRASAELIREGSESVQVAAAFRPPEEWARRWRPWFEDKGLPWEDGQLLLRRELRRDGKGRAWINGSAAPVSLLAELGLGLVDFHGQHDHQSLLRVPEHRGMLDRFAGAEAQLEAVASRFAAFEALRRTLEGPGEGPEARRRRLEFLEFQIRELEDLAPKAGEWEELRRSSELQARGGRRAESLGAALAALEGEEDGALAALGRAQAALRRLAEDDPERRSLGPRLDAALLDLRDASEGLGSALERVELDPAALERLQARLHAWEGLARKHRRAPGELPEAWEGLKAERDSLLELERDRDGLRARLDAAAKDYAAEALALGRSRERAAARLAKDLGAELRALVGPDCRFTVRLAPREDPGGPFEVAGRRVSGDRHGVEDVEFLFAANPGEQPKPLARIASGGELSRVALALKTVFARRDGAPCLVFDEVDAGVSGRVAALVGERVAALAQRHQVFCVTHLPQIASLPGRHFRVSKAVRQGRTLTEARDLDAGEREREVAALLDGGAVGDSALAHARRLLERAAEGVPAPR